MASEKRDLIQPYLKEIALDVNDLSQLPPCNKSVPSIQDHGVGYA